MAEQYQFIIRILATSPRFLKQFILILLDSLFVVASLWLAYCLRLGVVYIPTEQQKWIFVLAPLVAIPTFIYFGLYRAITRYIGMRAIWDIVRATIFFSLIFALIVLIFKVDEFVPRTIYGILALLVLMLVGGYRLVIRWWLGRFITQQHIFGPLRQAPSVIIYGAGSSGIELAAALKSSNQLHPVAFIDDQKQLQRQQINGLEVYPLSRLAVLIERYKVVDILLAIPSASKSRRAQIIEALEPYPVHVRTLPSLGELVDGKVTISDIREVEIGDLLGRDPVLPIQTLLNANITDKTVMVTGAGGSIGSELCRQIVRLAPKQVILFEQNEFALYEIERELCQQHPQLPIQALLGNVVDTERVSRVCVRFSVDTIYHAAAYKHVPMVERNTTEAIRNNIIGTYNCAQAAMASNVATFVLISTDKAVRPTNTMGATKRFAELVLQALSEQQNKSGTRFTMVRFGNVLDSSGSVVPLFRKQIESGGPVTVTDERITRYFMTIPEAAELVIQAGAMGQGGDVFVLDMGEPVRIVDLAKKMIHLSGFTERTDEYPDGDIDICFTGLRPGEKLYEELLIGENVTGTEHAKIMRAEETKLSLIEIESVIESLLMAYENNDSQQIRHLLLETIGGFEPQCDVQDLLRE